MVSLLAVLAIAAIVTVNTGITALLTRLFRVRLRTDWAVAVYVGFFVPTALTVSTILLGSIVGPNLGSRVIVLALFVGFPLAIGIAIDVLWMPPPEAVDLPEVSEE